MMKHSLMKYFFILMAGIVGNLGAYGQAPDYDSNLVLYYNFNQGGSLIQDLSGNGHTGTVYGTTALINDGIGGTYLFDGVDDHIRVPGSQDFDLFDFAILLWVRPDTYNASSFNPYVVVSSAVPEYSGGGIQLYLDSNLVRFEIRGGNQAITLVSPKVFSTNDNGQWHHVAARYHQQLGNSSMEIYVDGVLKTNTVTTTLPDYLGQTLFVGLNYGSPAAGFNQTYDREFKGEMDDLRIYNVAISSNSISQYYLDSRTNFVDSGSQLEIYTSQDTAYEDLPAPYSSQKGELAFHRTGDTSQPAIIQLAISGTAALGNDFGLIDESNHQSISNFLVMPANEDWIFVLVDALEDDNREGNETIQFSLLPSKDYVIGN